MFVSRPIVAACHLLSLLHLACHVPPRKHAEAANVIVIKNIPLGRCKGLTCTNYCGILRVTLSYSRTNTRAGDARHDIQRSHSHESRRDQLANFA